MTCEQYKALLQEEKIKEGMVEINIRMYVKKRKYWKEYWKTMPQEDKQKVEEYMKKMYKIKNPSNK